MIKRLARYAVALYVVQALVGISVGIYLSATMDPAEIERVVSCVAH